LTSYDDRRITVFLEIGIFLRISTYVKISQALTSRVVSVVLRDNSVLINCGSKKLQ